jgi:diaminopropionate ammonia-lyase
MLSAEISPNDIVTRRDFLFALNRHANRDRPWTAAQNDILSDKSFEEAKAIITRWEGYAPTPLICLPDLAAEAGVAAINYKDESGRFGLGSFKALGGSYAVARLLHHRVERKLARRVPIGEIFDRTHQDALSDVTVTCATDGNHGRSVAWGAEMFGCRCVIFIHAGVSQFREGAIARFGAEVRRVAGNYDDSVREAERAAKDNGWFVVSDTSYDGYLDVPRDVMQGYELMAAEALERLSEPPTHVFLQAGVGGMAAACAALAKRRYGADRPFIVLVEPITADCILRTVAAGKLTAVEGGLDTIMAGLACGEVSVIAWEILKDHADAVMALPDDPVAGLMRRLAEPGGAREPIVAGESAVAGLAGLMAAAADNGVAEAIQLTDQSRILLFGTEGDTDPTLYREFVGRSSAAVRQGALATDC